MYCPVPDHNMDINKDSSLKDSVLLTFNTKPPLLGRCFMLGLRKKNSFISKLGVGPEKRSVFNVFLKASVSAPLLHCLLLKDRNTTDMTQQEPDKEG